MKAIDGKFSNFAIVGPAEEMRRIPSILRNGICPSYRVPRKALTPGAEVALVDKSGRVILIFTLKSIREFEEERANGARCHLIAYAGTMRRPGKEDPKRLVVNRYGACAISYYDRKSRRPILYSQSDCAPEGEGVLSPFPASRKEYSGLADNVAETLSQPERAVIKGYTKRTRCAATF